MLISIVSYLKLITRLCVVLPRAHVGRLSAWDLGVVAVVHVHAARRSAPRIDRSEQATASAPWQL